MIVVDASVVVTALVDEGRDGNTARERLAKDDLVAPALIDLEVVSVLRRLESKGQLSERRALLAAEDLFDLRIERVTHRDLIPEVWQHRHNLSPYDAAYVVLAELLDVPFVTSDKRLSEAPNLACTVELLAG